VTRRRALRISLAAVAAGVVVLLLVSVTLVVITVRRPFPDYGGDVTLPGLAGGVTVLRDDRGVPQLYADTADDLFRAQGYVHAQDRFFEMDMRRHVTAGRLSELVGPNDDALRADIVVRTLGWRRVAERELKLLSARTRSYLDAYAAGVNDYLRRRSASSLSVAYPLLGVGSGGGSSSPPPRVVRPPVTIGVCSAYGNGGYNWSIRARSRTAG
jgi:penicillin amidase